MLQKYGKNVADKSTVIVISKTGRYTYFMKNIGINKRKVKGMIQERILDLVEYARVTGLIEAEDERFSINRLLELFQLDELEDGDILVLAGSIPATLPSDVYERIMGRLQGKDIRIVVDATKDLLLNVLKYHPFLIKPNNHELGEMFDVVLKTNDEIVEYAKKLQEKGARNVLVSMAGDGAILITEEGEVHVTPCPKGEVKNSVGAGDSMVAGFITGYLRSNGDYNEALKMGTAAGSATAFSEDVATGEKIMKLYKTL